jgi:hypothetical protein
MDQEMAVHTGENSQRPGQDLKLPFTGSGFKGSEFTENSK